MPTLWQKATLSGSPPCSPQMPTLRCSPVFSLRALRPLVDAHLDELADAGDVERLERVDREDLLRRGRPA